MAADTDESEDWQQADARDDDGDGFEVEAEEVQLFTRSYGGRVAVGVSGCILGACWEVGCRLYCK